MAHYRHVKRRVRQYEPKNRMIDVWSDSRRPTRYCVFMISDEAAKEKACEMYAEQNPGKRIHCRLVGERRR